jgi:hypothetical protein
MPRSLQELSDHLELDALVSRLWLALDANDAGSLRAIFTPDAVVEIRGRSAPTSAEDPGIVHDEDVTVDECIDTLAKLFAGGDAVSQHHITNRLFDVGGDSATFEAYGHVSWMRGTGHTVLVHTGGTRYVGSLTRTADGWRMQRYRVTRVWLAEVKHPLPL